jgi:hypothetical protein
MVQNHPRSMILPWNFATEIQDREVTTFSRYFDQRDDPKIGEMRRCPSSDWSHLVRQQSRLHDVAALVSDERIRFVDGQTLQVMNEFFC